MARTPKFQGQAAEKIAGCVAKHGLTGARAVLAEEGVQLKPGSKREKVDVSLPTLAKIAKAHNVTLKRGRRAA